MNKNLRTLLALVIVAVAAFTLLRCSRRKTEETPPPGGGQPVATEGRLQIFALNVGQGDSLLIVTPGGKHVLIDAGTPQAGDDVVAALQKHHVSSIDLAVATHPHLDHIGGMGRVMKTMPVKAFLDSGQDYTSATYERMIKAIRDKGIKYIEAKRGMTFDLDPGIRLEVLNPAGNKKWITDVRSGGSVQNANSVVLRLTYGSFAMLFTGDAEAETEAEMMKAGEKVQAQVLKVGHHGSRYATSDEFLNAVKPQAAIISAGVDNKYGHPTQSTLDRLQADKAQIFRTDLQGEIAVITDGKNFQVQPERQADAVALRQGRQSSKAESE